MTARTTGVASEIEIVDVAAAPVAVHAEVVLIARPQPVTAALGALAVNRRRAE